MKAKEKVRVLVRPAYFSEKDTEIVAALGILTDRPLRYEIEMLSLTRVEDVYKDGSAFQKCLIKGSGTASPYSDFQVLCKSNYEIV
jgi:hypothetical protein